MKRKFRSGLTVFELLLVIGIVAALSLFLIPVIANSKILAYQTSSLSALRQTGLAELLYANANDGKDESFTFDVLVDQGYLPDKHLLRAHYDNTPNGFGNHILLGFCDMGRNNFKFCLRQAKYATSYETFNGFVEASPEIQMQKQGCVRRTQ